ncbi:DUF6090 family protein [Formosa algae]|uniref:Uncharacterized membrane-anchored protein YhcB (DUF1043 family) n=1 Tax=Formosa algae TaxID=225843 RepID=A0A9X0YPJ4_9FLAO|nr:DUF6090 family protein [Formosa algae]MBP1841693.1 uncharacterized membrane-anchored protein YhcB (DUF1043 family) [Formosa algae]MDQ0337106.1 uncharacterized membrane-anchored protein YhcB (DUF1043 family) [Formosa algae]OEI80527.1 hypothetical protein AST99_08665 [Formosa algae]
MIKLFGKIRQKLLSENKFGKYLTYAIGEIVLVVIGILIALQINNWNENRKLQAEITDIYKQIVIDLDNDIDEFSNVIKYYDSIKPVYDAVFSDTRTIDLLDDGLSRIMAGGPITNMNKGGIERLKSVASKDSLSLHLIEIYDTGTFLNLLEKKISDESWLVTTTFRDNYSWYPEWISKRITKDNSSKELQDYFVNSQEYRHYVISSYQKLYNSYLPNLQFGIIELENIRKLINERIDK